MPVSLQKGGNVSLSKEAPGIKNVHFGLGWDMRVTDGTDFDLDASAFLLANTGKVASSSDFIFYNNKAGAGGAVEHKGDERTGAAAGDDEVITVNLEKLPAAVERITFCVTIHEADARKQNFGMVRNAFIRVVNLDGNNEVARYDLSEDASTETAMIFGELYRHGSEWKFKARGEGFAGGLGPLARAHGVDVG